MPSSVLVVHYDTSTGKYLVQKVGTTGISDAAITSALIASGAIGPTHIANEAVLSGHIGSGQIASGHLVSAIAALVGTVTDGGVTSAKLASGAVGAVHIADGAVASGEIAANAVGGAKLWDYGIISGKYASGSITEGALASGISIDIAEVSQEPSFRAQVPISGFLAVQYSVSGYFSHAQAADSDTIPAIGVTTDFINSGQIGTFQYQGRMTNAAWDFSGYVGSLLFVGTSSEVTLMVSGLMISGRCVQRLAKVADADTIFLKPELSFAQIAE